MFWRHIYTYTGTAAEAYEYTNGRVIFASGSPFEQITTPNNHIWSPGQANNCYVFPGIGLGIIISKAQRVTEEMMLKAAEALSEVANPNELARGSLYPYIGRARQASEAVAAAVAEEVFRQGLNGIPRPADITLRELARQSMWQPQLKVGLN